MISIIIPVYNVASTIKRTIDSCLNQTYKDIEIIIVDDCSSDNTVDIITNYNNDLIHLYKNTENVGPGLSRREALKHIKGQYTFFIDGDDYIAPEYLETMLNTSIKHDADIVSSSISYVYEEGFKEGTQYKPTDISYKNDFLLVGTSISTQVLNSLLDFYMNNKLIRSELWNYVEHSERRFYEDAITVTKLFYYAKKMVCLTYKGFYHYMHNNSVTASLDYIKFIIYNLISTKDIIEFIKDKSSVLYDRHMNIYTKKLQELNSLNITDEIVKELQNELVEIFTYSINKRTIQIIPYNTQKMPEEKSDINESDFIDTK